MGVPGSPRIPSRSGGHPPPHDLAVIVCHNLAKGKCSLFIVAAAEECPTGTSLAFRQITDPILDREPVRRF